jgi:hypothetical protein
MLVYFYQPAAFFRVIGDDSEAFLQGQFTNELRQPKDVSVYGLWLNQKGKVLADSYVLKRKDKEFAVASVASSAAVIRARLEEYIVADDVTLADETTRVHALAVSGKRCGELIRECLGVAPSPGQFLQRDELMLFPGRRSRDENYELIGSETVVADARHKLLALGGLEAAADEMEFMRISAGMPSIPQDIGPGDLPNEGGLEDEAISFTKGCYLGQEVMARLKNMGQIRRRLHIIEGPGAALVASAPLYQGERQVGQVRSVANHKDRSVALAMLSLVSLEPESGLNLAPNATPTVRIVPRG